MKLNAHKEIILFLISNNYIKSENDILSIQFKEFRNNNYIIKLKGGAKSIFIKKPKNKSGENSLEHEYSVLNTLIKHKPELATFIPSVVNFHKNHSLLILHYFENTNSIFSQKDILIMSYEKIFRDVINIIKLFHRINCKDTYKHLSKFKNAPSWIFFFHNPNFAHKDKFSKTNIKLADYLHSQKLYISSLEDILLEWNKNDFVHFDIKLDNIIIDKNSNTYLIDWELGRFGNHLWDIASLISSIILTRYNKKYKNIQHIVSWMENDKQLLKYIDFILKQYEKSFKKDFYEYIDPLLGFIALTTLLNEVNFFQTRKSTIITWKHVADFVVNTTQKNENELKNLFIKIRH